MFDASCTVIRVIDDVVVHMVFLSWPPLGGSRFLSLLILHTQCLHRLEPSGCFANDLRVEVI